MEALSMRMACIWRKYPGRMIMGEVGESENGFCARFSGV